MSPLTVAEGAEGVTNVELAEVVAKFVRRLTPPGGISENPSGFLLRCPNSSCNGTSFILSNANGSGICTNEPLLNVGGFRRYSPWEIATRLGMDVYGLYGLFMGPRPVNLADTSSDTAEVVYGDYG